MPTTLAKILVIALRIIFALILIAGAAGAAYFLFTENLISAFRGLAYKLLAFNTAAIGVLVMEYIYDWKHKIPKPGAYSFTGSDLARLWGLRVLGLCALAGWIFGSV